MITHAYLPVKEISSQVQVQVEQRHSPSQQTEACILPFTLERNSLLGLTKTGKTTPQAIEVNVIPNSILKLAAKCTQLKEEQSNNHLAPSGNFGEKKIKMKANQNITGNRSWYPTATNTQSPYIYLPSMAKDLRKSEFLRPYKSKAT